MFEFLRRTYIHLQCQEHYEMLQLSNTFSLIYPFLLLGQPHPSPPYLEPTVFFQHFPLGDLNFLLLVGNGMLLPLEDRFCQICSYNIFASSYAYFTYSILLSLLLLLY